jgi:hypothetical protein
MFNLDEAMEEWRRQMLAAGIKSPVPLDELESHLRDDVEAQISSGTEARQAFEIAAQRIGPAMELKIEFAKSHPNTPMKQNLINIAVIIATLAIGAGFALPATARWRDQETLGATGIALFLIGAAIFVYGAACGVIGVGEHLKTRPKA